MAEIQDRHAINQDHISTETDPVSQQHENGIESGLGEPRVDSPDLRDSSGLILSTAGKIVLDDQQYYGDLGYSFPAWKKWSILTVIFMVQVSMNFNASIYGNAITGLTRQFDITAELARSGQGAFLLCYAFGCELWAPFSEEFGRWPILQLSLFLVNVWQIPCALAPNFATVVGFRCLGGLCCAGGSVTLGMVADLFEVDDQQYAVLYVVLSSVGGSVIGPIAGGFIEHYIDWQWVFWVQLIMGLIVQAMHFFLVPETRATVMLDKKAQRMRKESPEKYGNCYGPNEAREKRLSCRELTKIWYRPYRFFFTEPIVLCLSLLSGFSDALIFTFLGSFSLVYSQWDFNAWQVGLAFVPIGVGYILAYLTFIPDIVSQRRLRHRKGSSNVAPERRLLGLLFEAPLEIVGLFGFAFAPMLLKGTNTWIAPMIFSSLVGIANFAIYYATIDYMVASYGPFSASATGGNGFARDFLAGVSAFYATPMYMRIGPPNNLVYASMTLGFIALVVTIPIYIFYWKGQWFRERSKFAQTLSGSRSGRRANEVGF